MVVVQPSWSNLAGSGLRPAHMHAGGSSLHLEVPLVVERFPGKAVVGMIDGFPDQPYQVTVMQ